MSVVVDVVVVDVVDVVVGADIIDFVIVAVATAVPMAAVDIVVAGCHHSCYCYLIFFTQEVKVRSIRLPLTQW